MDRNCRPKFLILYVDILLQVVNGILIEKERELCVLITIKGKDR